MINLRWTRWPVISTETSACRLESHERPAAENWRCHRRLSVLSARPPLPVVCNPVRVVRRLSIDSPRSLHASIEFDLPVGRQSSLWMRLLASSGGCDCQMRRTLGSDVDQFADAFSASCDQVYVRYAGGEQSCWRRRDLHADRDRSGRLWKARGACQAL